MSTERSNFYFEFQIQKLLILGHPYVLRRGMKDYSLAYRRHCLTWLYYGHIWALGNDGDNEAEKLKMQQHTSTDRSVTLGKDLEGINHISLGFLKKGVLGLWGLPIPSLVPPQ